MVDPTPWWKTAVIYQVYLRSFADGNGDGVGDLFGLLDRLPYLKDLGVDAIWLNPWYPSPMADGGYDVANYRDIDPIFGTLAEAETLLSRAHDVGIRVLIDIVPNHCSVAHPWFRSALVGGPGCAARDRFFFRPGQGTDSAQPPNDWRSRFGGPAWTRVTEPDGRPGEWYLHLFDSSQPDWNWENPEIKREFEEILHFWFRFGVDGFRIDVADRLVKHPDLPDQAGWGRDEHPYRDREGVHEIYRRWRHIADTYPGEKVFVGEIWTDSPEQFIRYIRKDELHSAFSFGLLACPWDEVRMREEISSVLSAHARVHALPTWVLSNHDVVRNVTRYGMGHDMSLWLTANGRDAVVDIELGTRRARASALLAMALPGSLYIYQGDELGLPEVLALPDHVRQDPIFARTEGRELGRDGCRVPLPWFGDRPPFGFSEGGVSAWLPQPETWKTLTVEAQKHDPLSMLNLYRAALRVRHEWQSTWGTTFRWIESRPGVLGFVRGEAFASVTNLSSESVELPPHRKVLLASQGLIGSDLPPDSTVWLVVAEEQLN